eukprot:COSAG02_NODE_1999_length_10148_cov_15.105483_8_plen_87_part_00
MALTSLTGHELLIIGFGAAGYCGLCDAQMLNASWVAWFKNEVEFAATKGVGISAYTLMQASMSNTMLSFWSGQWPRFSLASCCEST